LEWAFVDITSGKIRSDFLQEAERKILDRYERMDLRWVHRSAYDCILDSSFHDLAASLLPSNELDLARRALAAAAWVAKHTTQIAVISPASTSTSVHECIFSTVRMIVQFCKIRDIDLTEEVYEVLDDLFDAIQSSLYADGGLIWQKVLSKCALSWSVRHPMVCFWSEVCKLEEIDRYLLPRLERLELSGLAPEPLGTLINHIINNHPGPPPVVSCKALDILLRASGGGTHHAFCMSTGEADGEGNVSVQYRTMSFLGAADLAGDSAKEHAYMIHSLHMSGKSALRKVLDDSHHPWYNFNIKLLRVCEAWDISFGVAAEREPDRLSPLHIQWPQPDTSRLSHLSIPEIVSIPRLRQTMRLLCLDIKQIATGEIVRAGVFRVIACFDVSEECSKAMGDLELDDASQLGRFVESMGQERCLQLIIDDVWADQDKQLDAWQQLYLLACVETSFKHLWVAGPDQ
jgi:hypothetical protein